MTRTVQFSALATLLVFASTRPLYAQETADVLSQLERMCSLGEKAERTLGESIADRMIKATEM